MCDVCKTDGHDCYAEAAGETASPSSKPLLSSRKLRAFDWLETQTEFAISPPCMQGNVWKLFHNDEDKDATGKTLLEVIENVIGT